MNPKDFPNLKTRRDFFRQAACAAVGTLSISATLRDLRFINSAAAQGTFTDYKALVCIFLAGGNDSNNLVVPIGAGEYQNYAAIRQNLALYEANANPHPANPARNLIPIAPLNPDGHSYGLHPDAAELATLFGEGKLGLLFNAGPLVHPMTSAEYKAKTVPRPPQLFSHSDQVTHWQTSLPDQPPRTGWGGRVSDLMHPLQYELLNGVPTANSAKIALCTSLAGANTFEVGDLFAQYHVSTSGAVTLSSVTGSRLQALKDILALPDGNLQRTAYADVTNRAIDTGELLNVAIGPTDEAGSWVWNTPFPNTSLGRQLKMIARLVEAGARPSNGTPPGLDMQRQIFFAQVGGYDTHTAQVGAGASTDPTIGPHANLLNELTEAVFAFQRAMEQIGRSDQVTSFTASDFGRTFPTNGQGSDHGWGGHHFMVGGAVRGRRTYGTFPVHQINGPDDTSTGRWIPRTSVDEYSATLAKWFGVSTGDLQTVFPNIGNFAAPDLGFMA